MFPSVGEGAWKVPEGFEGTDVTARLVGVDDERSPPELVPPVPELALARTELLGLLALLYVIVRADGLAASSGPRIWVRGGTAPQPQPAQQPLKKKKKKRKTK